MTCTNRLVVSLLFAATTAIFVSCGDDGPLGSSDNSNDNSGKACSPSSATYDGGYAYMELDTTTGDCECGSGLSNSHVATFSYSNDSITVTPTMYPWTLLVDGEPEGVHIPPFTMGTIPMNQTVKLVFGSQENDPEKLYLYFKATKEGVQEVRAEFK